MTLFTLLPYALHHTTKYLIISTYYTYTYILYLLFANTTILIRSIPSFSIITIRSTPCFVSGKCIQITSTAIQVQKVWCIDTLFFLLLLRISYCSSCCCLKSRTSSCLDRKKIMRITPTRIQERRRYHNLRLVKIGNQRHKRVLSELLGVYLDMYSRSQ